MGRCWLAVVGLAACSFQHGISPHDGAATPDVSWDGGPDGSALDAAIDAAPVGLLAWYQMETLSSSEAADATGNGHTGTCGPLRCPLVAAAPRGQGYVFVAGDRIDVPAEGSLAGMTGFTVAFWARLDAALGNKYACPVQKGLGTTFSNSWQFCFEPPNATMYFWTSEMTVDILRSTTAMPVAEWHHVAITWNGSTKQVWFDGVSVANDTGKSITWDLRDLTIGADVDDLTTHASVNDLVGGLDDVRIYDHALTSAEIAVLAH